MRIYTNKYFLLLMLFVMGEAKLRAQTIKWQNSITGSLTNEKGKPLDFATISLLWMPDSAIKKGTLTSETGFYPLSNLTAGIYVIKASNIGYQSKTSEPLFVSSTTIIIAVLVLIMQTASHTLNTVTIFAARPLVERKSDRTIMNVANSVLSTGNSALEILAGAPGVSLDKDDNIPLKGKTGRYDYVKW